MSKIVRASKYRHVFGSVGKSNDCYTNLSISTNPWDSPMVAVSTEYLAICWQTSGGGAAGVIPLGNCGKMKTVHLCSGHRGPVLDVAFSPFHQNLLATASEDAMVKVWLIPEGGLTKDMTECHVELRGHNRKVGSVLFNPVSDSVLASASFDYRVIVWDLERAQPVSVLENEHKAVIQSLCWDANGSHYCTFAKDKNVRVVDPRSNRVELKFEAHSGVKGGRAGFLSDGRIYTVGFSRMLDRQLAIWDPKNTATPQALVKIDNSASAMIPIYDAASNIIFVTARGDSTIRYYEVVSDSDVLYYLSSFPAGAPQQGITAFPKHAVDVRSNEIMRLYKATTSSVEPISFVVPRRAEEFQADLFPDVPGMVPALNVSDWIAGKNANPILVSMNPDAGPRPCASPRPQRIAASSTTPSAAHMSQRSAASSPTSSVSSPANVSDPAERIKWYEQQLREKDRIIEMLRRGQV